MFACRGVRWRAGSTSQVPALKFHVNYWDDFGWSDRLGLPESMKRQRTYTRSRRRSCTSLSAIDGRESLVGNDLASIGRDLAAARSGASVKLPIRGGDRRPHRLVAAKHRTLDHRIQHRALIPHDGPMGWRTNRVLGVARYQTMPLTCRSLFQSSITYWSLVFIAEQLTFTRLTSGGAARTLQDYGRLTCSSAPATPNIVLKADRLR